MEDDLESWVEFRDIYNSFVRKLHSYARSKNPIELLEIRKLILEGILHYLRENILVDIGDDLTNRGNIYLGNGYICVYSKDPSSNGEGIIIPFQETFHDVDEPES